MNVYNKLLPTTKIRQARRAQNETAVALPAPSSDGETGVIEAFFGYTEKTAQVGKTSMRSVPMNRISRQIHRQLMGRFNLTQHVCVFLCKKRFILFLLNKLSDIS